MGGVSPEMCYRNDDSIKQPFSIVLSRGGGVFIRTQALPRDPPVMPRGLRGSSGHRGPFSGALP